MPEITRFRFFLILCGLGLLVTIGVSMTYYGVSIYLALCEGSDPEGTGYTLAQTVREGWFFSQTALEREEISEEACRKKGLAVLKRPKELDDECGFCETINYEMFEPSKAQLFDILAFADKERVKRCNCVTYIFQRYNNCTVEFPFYLYALFSEEYHNEMILDAIKSCIRKH